MINPLDENSLSIKAEEHFGIKADTDNIEKLLAYILDKYGSANQKTINKVFLSGEAANFLTINETYFFREPVHFTFLNDLLPSYEKTGIRICCAAVAAGCEAYSIAMLIEAYNRGAQIPVNYSIDAFDVNPVVIETARMGNYGERSLREDGNSFHYMAKPYLKKNEGENMSVRYQVDPCLKKNITFFVHNLMDELPAKEYDIIFFRNVFIYLSKRYRERIFSNLTAAMKEGGILITGVSETAGVNYNGIEGRNLNDVFYFQKPVFSVMGN